MSRTSNLDSKASSLRKPSREGMSTCRRSSVSIRNVGVPVSNQYGPNSRLLNSSNTSNGLYTFSSPRQL